MLNEKGFKIGVDGKPFSKDYVNGMIQKHDLLTRRTIVNSDNWLTTKEKIAEIGVGARKLRRMRNKGELIFKACHLNGGAYLYKPRE